MGHVQYMYMTSTYNAGIGFFEQVEVDLTYFYFWPKTDMYHFCNIIVTLYMLYITYVYMWIRTGYYRENRQVG